MPVIIGVKFQSGGKTYYFDPCDMEFAVDDGVIVETSRGIEFGKVSVANEMVTNFNQQLKPVIRKATADDYARVAGNIQKTEQATKVFAEKIAKHKLQMKVVSSEYTFDRSKVILYFTAESRIDFRDLVKDLASVLRVRIELRQIYERDDIKMRGAMASCGRPCCCINHLPDFEKVSIKMAKTQGLSLNPTKISGACGKLMCCLKYENDYYAETIKKMPKRGCKIKTPDGIGTVENENVLKQIVNAKVHLADDTYELRTYKLKDIKIIGTQQTLADELEKGSPEEKNLKNLE